MKTPEQVLHAFYTFWMSERANAIAGLTEDNFVTHFGLCSSLRQWMDMSGVIGDLWIDAGQLQGKKLALDCGDPENTTPFNTGRVEYEDEKSSDACHLNTKRVAFVERMIKELAP